MEIKKIVSFSCDENCYLLHNGKSGILIDPGEDYNKIISECGDLKIEYILFTHCHYDHVKSAEQIKEITGAAFVGSEKCSKNLTEKIVNASYLFNDECEFLPTDKTVTDGEILKTDIGEILCVYTPGHTDCSVCYVSDGHIFSGDTLFKLSVGRWDLLTGDAEALKMSVKDKLYSFPNDYSVHPGHGADTSIGYEKKHNLFIKAEQ